MQVKKGDVIRFFDQDSRFRAARVTKVGHKWITLDGDAGRIKKTDRFEVLSAADDNRVQFTNGWLEQQYRRLNAEIWGNKLPPLKADTRYNSSDYFAAVRVEWSSRMTTSAGIYYRGDKVIKMSPHYAKRYPDDVINVLAHEMLHIQCPNHGRVFRAAMRAINAKHQTRIRLRSKGRAKEAAWIYECERCGYKYERSRRYTRNGRGHCCRKCWGALIERRNDGG